jgi:hypothetical protein
MSNVIENLLERHLVVAIDNPESDIASQETALVRLKLRALSGDNRTRFLSEYDAIMRTCEMFVMRQGFRFGSMPHLAMNVIVSSVLPAEEIRQISKRRHEVKKGPVIPSDAEVHRVRGIRLALAERLDN